jgi:hypothetical protein
MVMFQVSIMSEQFRLGPSTSNVWFLQRSICLSNGDSTFGVAFEDEALVDSLKGQVVG